MIGSLSTEEFVAILHKHVSPTSPVQSQEHLFGRERQVGLIRQALYAPGRSVFIYGDRGVGKTSLAQTVAYSHQSSKRNPVLLACEPKTTFLGLMAKLLMQLRGAEQTTSKTTTHNIKVGYHGIGMEAGRSRTDDIATSEQISDLNDVIAALLAIGLERPNESTVVVIDEFDRITSDEERTHFADFIKQLGDQRVPVQFVFCGVAESMQKLLGTHGSCYRYLDGIELKNLTYEARFEIIDTIARALGVQVDDRPRFRIAAISDGFPHYIHRMCEKLFWEMFNDPFPCEVPSANHYREAVIGSVKSIEQHLKVTYDQAVMKDAPGYEQVLWAVADHSDMIRKTEGIYSSYGHVMSSAAESDEEILLRSIVVSRLNALKESRCGCILSSSRKGWYQFREGIMRGYVRLRAEEQGCELALDYAAASSPRSDLTWRPRPAKRPKLKTSPRGRKKTQYPS